MYLNQIISALNSAISERLQNTTFQIVGLTLPAVTEDKQPLNISQNTFEDFQINDRVEVNIFHRATAIEYVNQGGKGAGHKYKSRVTVALVCQSTKPRIREMLEEVLSGTEYITLNRANLTGKEVHKEFLGVGEYDYSRELFAIYFNALATNEPCKLKF